MHIQNIAQAQYEDVLRLERELFGTEALDRYGLVQHLRIFGDSSLVAAEGGQVQGYALGLVKSTGEAWVTALATQPQALRHTHLAIQLASALAQRLQELHAHVAYATTRRRSIVLLARRFNGRVVDTVDDYFLDGQPRQILEFRP